MNLSGKKVIFIGDSITEGACASKKENIYHHILQRDLNLREIKNFGIGGTRIARKTIPSLEHLYDMDFNLRFEIIKHENADCVFVLGGVNDFGHGDAKLGDKNDTSVYTFYGALNTLYDNLIARYNKDNVVILTPMHTTFEKEESEGKTPLKKYVDAIIEVSKSKGLKVIDLFSQDLLNPNIEENARYFADGLHPNDEGHALLAKIIEKELEKL